MAMAFCCIANLNGLALTLLESLRSLYIYYSIIILIIWEFSPVSALRPRGSLLLFLMLADTGEASFIRDGFCKCTAVPSTKHHCKENTIAPLYGAPIAHQNQDGHRSN